MTENEFLALGRAGFNRIPLQLETYADLDTPLSIYLKLANAPGSYLLESVIGGERFGRYSMVGLPAREHLVVRADPDEPGAYAQAQRRLQQLRAKLRDRVELPSHDAAGEMGAPRSNIGEAAFYDAVARSKRYITEGDIMQVQVSQRITQP